MKQVHDLAFAFDMKQIAEEEAMPYAIDTPRLVAFVEEQARLIDVVQMPGDLADLCRPAAGEHELTADELHAVWLAAGLASQVGLALVEQPERFIHLAAVGAVR